MDEPFFLRRDQTVCDLDADFENALFRHAFQLRDQIIEAPVIDQFHHHIKLTVIAAQRVNLHDMGVINRRRDAGFVLQLRGGIGRGAGFRSEKFQRDEALELCVARFVNGAHAARAERFEQEKIIEGTIDAQFLTAPRAGDARQRLGLRRVDLRAARRTRLNSGVSFRFGLQGGSNIRVSVSKGRPCRTGWRR